MPVVINYSICDRGQGCPCIKACPNKAFFYSYNLETPKIDESKCKDCGICIKTCPARAAYFAYNKAGLKQLKTDFESDKRNAEELKELHFNSDPITNKNMCKEELLEKIIKAEEIIIEFTADKVTSRCIQNSPKYSEILPEKTEVLRIDAEINPEVAEKYKVFTVPSLLIFKNGQLKGRITGCCSIADREVLKEKLANLL